MSSVKLKVVTLRETGIANVQDDIPVEIDYQHFFNAQPNSFIAFALNDPSFTIIAENQAHATIALSDHTKNIGKPVFDVFPDNTEKYKTTGVSDLLTSFRKVIRTSKPDTMPVLHYDVKDKDGNFVEKWWRVTHYPGFDKRGNLTYIYQATEDITNEILTSQKFELARSQLDSALAIGLVSTWSWEIDSDVVIGDKNLAASFGISPELAASGLPLQTFINSIHPEDRDRITQAIQKSVTSKKEYDQEYRTVDKAGKIRWVIARGRIETDHTTNTHYLLGVVVDITARKKAEEELSYIKSMFDALFQSTVLCIAVADMQGNVLQANKTFLKTFGYSAADLKKGLTSKQLTSPKSRGATDKVYDALRQHGEAEPTEKEYVRKDGTKVPMLIGAVMLPTTDDQFIAFMLDISENKELKALNQAKDEFIGMASHQLRTPATVVKQYISLLATGFGGPLNDRQQEFADKAYSNNERQLRIVNDLLKTAQIDSDTYVLNKHRIAISTLVSDALSEMHDVLEHKKQTVTVEGSAQHLRVYADRTEINLVLVNLIENASKYSPDATNITITSAVEDDTAVITIKDEGVGMTRDEIGRIFNKFTRVDNKLSDTVSGSGLGLYWVDKIVKMHAGQIKVVSKPNKGSSFAIHLPYEK